MDTNTTRYRPGYGNRRTIFIKKKLQYHYMAVIFASVLVGFMIMATEVVLTLSHMASTHPTLIQPLMDEVMATLPISLLKMGIYLAIVLIVSSVISHHMAGPIYKFEKSAASIGEGNLKHMVSLRQRDQLTDLKDEFNKMTVALRGKVEHDRNRALLAAAKLRELAAKSADAEMKTELEKTANEISQITSGFTI